MSSPSLEHAGEDLSGEDDGRLEVQPHDGSDPLRVDHGCGLGRLEASVVDEHVNRAVCLFDLADEVSDLQGVEEVDGMCRASDLRRDVAKRLDAPRG